MNRIPWEKILSFSSADLVKLVISAVIIVFVTKIQLVNDRFSALLVALPITSLIAMFFMHHEGQSPQRLANHAESTFWFVIPSLPMFLILPWMLRHGWSFRNAIAVNALITIGTFWITVSILRRFGIDLIPR